MRLLLDAHNASNAEIARVLLERQNAVAAFIASAEFTMLVLGVPRTR